MRFPRAFCCLVLCAPVGVPCGAQATASGITFATDTVRVTQDLHPDPGGNREMEAFASFSSRVTYAAGRGRLDVIARRGGPVVLVDGVASTRPLAMPGDYYLFDSTGFVLVRPGTRTFFSFSISDDSYNYAGRRDGWPQFFQFQAARFDTVAAAAMRDTPQHGPVHLYWHADAFATQAIARGRLTIDDAPMSEMTVVQWFGAARAIARLADSAHVFRTEAVTLTTAVPEAAGGTGRVPVSFILKQDLMHLETANIDLSRLVLPADFTEAPWPGHGPLPVPSGPAADKGARWRKAPEARR